jgi:hypothetical protein
MPTTRRNRVFGERLRFKSLSCAPVNELGVVYLFGVLHEAFDFEIESIQAGFPDCIARRRISDERWEEVRIEFEFRSRSFVAHGHDPAGVDVIVCWRHDWPGCPASIEVIELSTVLADTEQIADHVKTEKRLTDWQEACRKGRLAGLTFTEIARGWKHGAASTAQSPARDARCTSARPPARRPRVRG